MDTLEVYHRAPLQSSWSLIHPEGYYCTSDPGSLAPLYSYANVMRIIFKSSPWNGASGFIASYTTIPSEWPGVCMSFISSY